MKKESMDSKASKQGYMGEFGRRKGKGKWGVVLSYCNLKYERKHF